MVDAKTQTEHEAAAEILYKEIEPKTGFYPAGTLKEVAFYKP